MTPGWPWVHSHQSWVLWPCPERRRLSSLSFSSSTKCEHVCIGKAFGIVVNWCERAQEWLDGTDSKTSSSPCLWDKASPNTVVHSWWLFLESHKEYRIGWCPSYETKPSTAPRETRAAYNSREKNVARKYTTAHRWKNGPNFGVRPLASFQWNILEPVSGMGQPWLQASWLILLTNSHPNSWQAALLHPSPWSHHM